MKVKCMECGYVKESRYMHDVCRKCGGSMHVKHEKSLLQAYSENDEKLIRRIENKIKKGGIVRII